MAHARLLARSQTASGAPLQRGALDLARRLPQLMIAAKDIAATVIHGVHGRKRAGVGETFWQFRPFVHGESAGDIDWRRSARDDRMYVREREWEAAHTVWLWIDRSPSMDYVSDLARQPKIDRALTLGLAAADLLVRAGERVGLLSVTRPLATRGIVERLAEALLDDERKPSEQTHADLPLADPLPARCQAVLIGDFLSPAGKIKTAIEALSARGAAGHVVMIADPVEETFPFAGHVEFTDSDSPARLRVGRAEVFRATYVEKLALHREALRAVCHARGWSFAIHRTDRPAAEALLALRMRLEDGGKTYAGSA